MSDFDTVAETPPVPDAETMLTPITKIGVTPRAQMVRKLADIVVLPNGRISSNERALVADILLQVIDKVELDLRIEVASRIANVSDSPPALVRMLLLDTPEVARQIIEGAEHLAEALLIEAAREGDMAHRMMIAKRNGLTTAVADVILSFHEIDVCKAVLKRQDCLLSPNAINQLVAHSATRVDLQLPLLRRAELEPAHGFMMFWWVQPEQRKRILTRFALDRGIIQDALADLYPKVFRTDKPDPFVKDILILCERRHRARGVNGEQVSMSAILRTMGAARKYPAQEIIEAVALIAGISRELAARILRDPGGEPFAILCKSLGMPRDQFYSLFVGEDCETEEGKESHPDYLLTIFDTMARDFSRAILRYWDWDSNPRIAYITHLLGLSDDIVE